MSDLSARLETLRQHADVGPLARIDLIDHAQFTNSDVEAACHVSATQLHNWVSRGWIKLASATPGRGRRRLYSGKDAVAVAIAAALQPFGMMQIAEQMNREMRIPDRAYQLLIGLNKPDYVLAITPDPEGDDWLYTAITPKTTPADLPCPGFVLLEVDRLIIETLENLVRILNDEKVEPRKFPKKPTPEESEDEYLAEMGMAYRDEEGRRIFRGLTVEESVEYQAFKEGDRSFRFDPDKQQRYYDLQEKNEIARNEYNATRGGAE
jgi:hypothetical protein